MRCLLVIVALTLVVGGRASAHPRSPNAAVRATTIAELRIGAGQIALNLEIGAADRPRFTDLLSGTPTAFFHRGLVIAADDGPPLVGRVVSVRERRRTLRDERTGQPLDGGGGEPVVEVDVRYPLAGRPRDLRLSPPDGTTVGLVAVHGAVPVNDFDFLNRRSTLRLDWAAPWRSRFRGLGLQRREPATPWGELTVNGGDVRFDLFLRPDATAGLSDRVALRIDGRTVTPARRPAVALRQALGRLEPADAATPRETRVTRLGCAVELAERPNRVELIWDDPEPLPVWVNASAGPEQATSAAPVTWTDPMPPDVLALTVRAGGRQWLIAVCVVLPTVLAAVIRRPGVACGCVCVAVTCGGWFVFAPPLDAVESRRVARALLVEVYRAFDASTEEVVYDRLAENVSGDPLRDLYLSIRRGLDAQPDEGRPRIRNVTLLSAAPRRGGVRCRWTADVAVAHGDHTHVRQLNYDADLSLAVRDGRWVISGMTVHRTAVEPAGAGL